MELISVAELLASVSLGRRVSDKTGSDVEVGMAGDEVASFPRELCGIVSDAVGRLDDDIC